MTALEDWMTTAGDVGEPTFGYPKKELITSRGIIHLRTHCPACLVEELELDPGLGVFWNYRPNALERQREVLQKVARAGDGNVVAAYTDGGTIVAYVLFCSASENERWGLRGPRELCEMGALEVSRGWRGLGILRRLLELAFEDPRMETMIVFTVGFAWHWDLAETGLSKYEYRKILMNSFKAVGFEQFPTDEPNITMDGCNFLMARVGSKVPSRAFTEFVRILHRDSDRQAQLY